jgi:hypothetical protein
MNHHVERESTIRLRLIFPQSGIYLSNQPHQLSFRRKVDTASQQNMVILQPGDTKHVITRENFQNFPITSDIQSLSCDDSRLRESFAGCRLVGSNVVAKQ